MLYFLLIISTGLLFGIVQGMIMLKKYDATHTDLNEIGIRGHVLFKVYHFIFCLFCASLIIFSIITWEKRPDSILLIPKYISMLGGCFLIGWSFSEFSYPFIRWGQWTRYMFGKWQLYEHLVLFDFYSRRLYGREVVIAHAVRIILGISLLMLGGV